MANNAPEPRVISESKNWIVLDKPPAWLTVPGRASPRTVPLPVLSEWASERFGRVWTVHRLDRDTSGVILFARNEESHRRANDWFQNRLTRKIYHCIGKGTPSMPMIRLSQPIEGVHAVTQIEIVERFGESFLARARILTGRRHQIRIHLSGAGYPLWGDAEHGGPTEVRAGAETLRIPRVALHAAQLALPDGEVYEAPWPEDFAGWIERLRQEKGDPKRGAD